MTINFYKKNKGTKHILLIDLLIKIKSCNI